MKICTNANLSESKAYILPLSMIGILLLTLLFSFYLKGSFNELRKAQSSNQYDSTKGNILSVANSVRPQILQLTRAIISLPFSQSIPIDNSLIQSSIAQIIRDQHNSPAFQSLELNVRCLYEGREDATFDEVNSNLSPCTSASIFPKVFIQEIRLTSPEGVRLVYESIEKVSPERLLDYAYLITNESRPEVRIGAGNFEGQFGIIFRDTSGKTIRFAADESESINFEGLFVTNLSENYFQFGLNGNSYGPVNFNAGKANVDYIPDIGESFERLRETARTTDAQDGSTPLSAKILLGGEGNECKAEIIETFESTGCSTSNNPNQNWTSCQVIQQTRRIPLANNELSENTTYLVRGQQITVDSFSSSSPFASLCANQVTFLTEGGDVVLKKSIQRKKADGTPVTDQDATAALVSLDSSIQINSNFVTLNGERFSDRIHDERTGGPQIPNDELTAQIELSLIAPSENQSALRINPLLIDPSRSVGLGILKTNGIIATGTVSDTKTYFNTGLVGFNRVDLSYNQGIFDRPPPGLDSSITGLPLSLNTDRIRFRVISFEQALQALATE